MTPERWSKIKELFSSAQDISDAEREELLLRACGGDAELKGEVEKLLEASRDDDFLEDSAVAEVASAHNRDDAVSDEAPPRFFAGATLNDRYGIVRLLGRGRRHARRSGQSRTADEKLLRRPRKDLKHFDYTFDDSTVQNVFSTDIAEFTKF